MAIALLAIASEPTLEKENKSALVLDRSGSRASNVMMLRQRFGRKINITINAIEVARQKSLSRPDGTEAGEGR